MFTISHFAQLSSHLFVGWRLSLRRLHTRLIKSITFFVPCRLKIVFLILLIVYISEFIDIGQFSQVHVHRHYLFKYLFLFPFLLIVPLHILDYWHCSIDLECSFLLFPSTFCVCVCACLYFSLHNFFFLI